MCGNDTQTLSYDTADAVARHIILLGEDEAATNIFTVKTFATGNR